jgi:DNA-binding NtrC family response regulator
MIMPNGSTRPDAPEMQRALRLLLVGEDSGGLRDLSRYSDAESARLERAADSPAALRILVKDLWDAVLVHLDEDPEQQLGWWVDILRRTPRRPRLVALVPAPAIGFALRAGQLGVFEVLTVPVVRDRFSDLIRRMRVTDNEKPLPLREANPIQVGSGHLVSASTAMLPVFQTIAQVAPSTATVLILGESGTGKELVAKAIQLHGPRSARPFVAVNCSAIPENLLESELFGHEKGAFTGAVTRKIGRFERAHGGTLFLDEIGDMSLSLQSKILRAVQEREIERVGGSEPIHVDVRMIAATNQDLTTLIEQGRFREDLYYRLAVVVIKLPRLAERENDVSVLTSHFLSEFGKCYGKSFTAISDQALELLRQHEWLGNVRELRNVIERAVLVADDDVLRADNLPEEWRATVHTHRGPPETNGLATLRDLEAHHIERVLAHTSGHLGEAARILGVHRNTLARKAKEYGL